MVKSTAGSTVTWPNARCPLSAATARPALAVSRLPPALSSSSPLQAAIVAWCDHLRQESSTENTVKAFGGDLRQLSTFVSAAKNVGLVTTRELSDWLAWQRNVKRCSPKTYARRITSLKSFFRWLTETNVIGRDPAAAIIQQTVLSPLPEILSTQEVEAALAAVEAIDGAELIAIVSATGIKKFTQLCGARIPAALNGLFAAKAVFAERGV